MATKQSIIKLPLKSKTRYWLGRPMNVILDKNGAPLVELSNHKGVKSKGRQLVQLLNRIGEEVENSELLQSIFKEAGIVVS